MVAQLNTNNAGSTTARWYTPAKVASHRRTRRAVKLALKGHAVRSFTVTTKEGALLRAL